MRTIVFGLILFLCIFQFGFAKIYNGIGMQMTKNGTGVYYKQLCSLTEVSQFTASSGLHFDNTRQKTGILGLDNNYQSIMLDLTTGYRSELFQKELSGSFRPIFIFGAGGISEIKSFSKDNIAGTWIIKYMMGIGFNFYNRNILNEISLKYIHSRAIKGHAAFQIAFYWK